MLDRPPPCLSQDTTTYPAQNSQAKAMPWAKHRKHAAIKHPETRDMLQQQLAEKLQQIPDPEPTNNKDQQYVQNRSF